LTSIAPTPPPENTLTSALLFRAGETVFGADGADVRELIPLGEITRLPGAPAYVRGLINVRGTIVTILDLGVRLDSSAVPATEGSILLVSHRERLVGVVVDEVADVRQLEVDPSGASQAAGDLVRGVATLDGAPVVVLDLAALIRQVLLS
jgi:purine-binding chemotaxis protein CheW